MVRRLQAATVLPICALTLATGGDDLPVLGLCLLGLALAATAAIRVGRVLAIGAAAALKLFAWPVRWSCCVYAAWWPVGRWTLSAGAAWPCRSHRPARRC